MALRGLDKRRMADRLGIARTRAFPGAAEPALRTMPRVDPRTPGTSYGASELDREALARRQQAERRAALLRRMGAVAEPINYQSSSEE